MNLVEPNISALARNGREACEIEPRGAGLAARCPATIQPASGGANTRVAACACDYAAGDVVAAHVHERGQVIYAAAGRLQIDARAKRWILSPADALWVPPGIDHGMRMLSRVRLRSLSIDPASAAELPSACTILTVSDFLRAAVLRLIAALEHDPTPGRAERLGATLLDELGALTHVERGVDVPSNPRLRALCDAFLSEPGSSASSAEWAERFGMSRKSLALAFRRELQTSFGAWRRAVRVEEAKRRIIAGATITDVALDLGYESLSAFTAMFRRTTGFAPSKLLDRAQTGGPRMATKGAR